MMNRPDRTAVLKESKYPFLFIIGTDDSAVPLNDSLAQVSFLKIPHAHILQGVAHLGMWEQPDLVSGFIKEYISEVLNT
jgi:pimeloyl-ACP methyl ester carboxylesterase